MRIIWEGILRDNRDEKTRVRVGIKDDLVWVEEYDTPQHEHPDGEGWHECQDDGLTADAMSQAILQAYPSGSKALQRRASSRTSGQ